MHSRLLVTTLALGFLAGLAGCGPDNSVSQINISPEARKADDGGQAAMVEFMKSQAKAKKAAKTAAPAGGVAPR